MHDFSVHCTHPEGKGLTCLASISCRQLGPVVRSIHAATGVGKEKGLAVSLLERFIEYNTACAPGRRTVGLAPASGAARILAFGGTVRLWEGEGREGGVTASRPEQADWCKITAATAHC